MSLAHKGFNDHVPLSMQMTVFLPNSMYTTHGNFMFVFLNFTYKMYLKMQVTALQNVDYIFRYVKYDQLFLF